MTDFILRIFSFHFQIAGRFHKLFYRILFPVIILNFSFLISLAQSTTISGKVTDELTGEPIPFVSVIFKGTAIGMNTDFNGMYDITTSENVDSVVFRSIGYTPVVMRVKKHQVSVINIVMKVNKFELREAVVHAGEDPAIILFRKVVAHKDENDKSNLDYYQYEVYNKVEFDLTNFDKLKKNKLLKPFSFIWDKIDSTETNKKPFLPFFITENLSDLYYRNKPQSTREYIKASKISGLENESVTQFLGDMNQNFNVYDNYLDIFNKSLVSPVANLGLTFYKYSLVDSASIDGNWCYKLTFKPRLKQSNTFIGDMWIHDTTFAVKKISMRIADDVNINFLEDMAIVQQFVRVDNTYWMKQKTNLVLQFAPREKGMAFIGRKSTSYKDIIVNKPIADSVFSGTSDVVINQGSLKQDENYWLNARHDSLSDREHEIYHLVDTIKKLPAFQTYVDLITLFVTGYRDFGMLEYGPYFNTVSFNSIEGLRLRVGGRTSEEFSKHFVIDGYVAYGFKDQKFKYGGGVKYWIKRKPREFVGVTFKNDIQQLGQSENAFQDDNILSSLFRRSPSDKLTKIVFRQAYYEKEWFNGFSNRFTVSSAQGIPLGALSYAYFPEYPSKTDTQNTITTSEIGIYTRFLLHEKFIEGSKGRISVGSKFPLMQLKLSFGFKDVLHSDFNYTRAVFKIDDEIYVKPIGWGYYVLEVGKVWGQVPYPLLVVHPGNETYFYDYLAFSMMNYYEFISDQYVSVFYTHHFDGFFLDRIPLLRKLKWREIVQAKAVYGSLNTKNREILVNQNSFSSLKKPYAEAGVGIENILKILRIDFLWRLDYNDTAYKNDYKERFPGAKFPPRFGIRGSLQFIF